MLVQRAGRRFEEKGARSLVHRRTVEPRETNRRRVGMGFVTREIRRTEDMEVVLTFSARLDERINIAPVRTSVIIVYVSVIVPTDGVMK